MVTPALQPADWFRSRPALLPLLAAAALAACPGGAGGSGSADMNGFRNFSNKEGRVIEARVLSVSPDRKLLKIAQRDGREFELEIVLLSLDDQQHLREWLAANPLAAPPRRLEVAVEKTTARPGERRREGYYRLNTDHVAYRFKIRNLDRDTVGSPRLEYYLLSRDGVRIYQIEGTWVFTRTDRDDAPLHKVRGEVELEDLAFNREHVVVTDAIEIERVQGDGNYLYGEDELIGVILRIHDDEGRVIGTWRSSEPAVARLDWDEVAGGGEDPRGRMRPRFRMPVELEQGERDEAAGFNLAGVPFSVSATVVPDRLSPDGVIAAHGDREAGWVLLAQERQVIFAVRSGDREARASARMPEGTFRLRAELAGGEISVQIGDLPPVAESSPGYLPEHPRGPLAVGWDDTDPVLESYEPPFRFRGTIEGFSLRPGRMPPPGVP